MKPAPSIRDRLVSTLVVLTLAWAALASASVWLTIHHEVDELLDDTLAASAEVLATLLPAHPATVAEKVWASSQVATAHQTGRYAWQWIDDSGRLRARSAQAPAMAWRTQAWAGYGHIQRSDGAWRIYGHPLDDGSMVYVAQSRAERLEARADVALNVTVGALLLGAVFAGWLLRRVHRELQPLADLSATLRQHDLLSGAALPDPGRLELQALCDAINTLGRHLVRRLAQERAIAAQVAHALRTPLAGLDAQLASAQVCAPAHLPQALQRARQASRQLRHVVAGVISLFRSAGDIRRVSVDVCALLSTLPVEGMVVGCRADVDLQADPDLLAAAVSNLLDNAQRLGASRVEVAVLREGHGQAIELRDDGPGMPEPQRHALQTALDAQSYEGPVGMGLMLADLVARSHGGRLRLESAAVGCVVRLDLGPST